MLNKITRTTWVMQNGASIKIKHMTDTHLVNTVRMLQREGRRRLDQDIAHAFSIAHVFDQEETGSEIAAERLEETSVEEYLREKCLCYPAMLREVAKRGLEGQVNA